MRQPRPALAPVDGERLQARLDVVRERRRECALVVEDEHPDAARLAVALEAEPQAARTRGGVAQRADDRLQLPCRPVAEEGERDVQVLARDDADAAQLLLP